MKLEVRTGLRLSVDELTDPATRTGHSYVTAVFSTSLVEENRGKSWRTGRRGDSFSPVPRHRGVYEALRWALFSLYRPRKLPFNINHSVLSQVS